jgi:hypothetical protein
MPHGTAVQFDAIIKMGFKHDAWAWVLSVAALIAAIVWRRSSKHLASGLALGIGIWISLFSTITLAKWILSGRNIDRGGQPYQDFALLMRLRNDLVHTKPNRLFVHGVTTNEEAHGALLARFRDKNILADDNVTGSWTYLAQTKAVAEWSCRTAAYWS